MHQHPIRKVNVTTGSDCFVPDRIASNRIGLLRTGSDFNKDRPAHLWCPVSFPDAAANMRCRRSPTTLRRATLAQEAVAASATTKQQTKRARPALSHINRSESKGKRHGTLPTASVSGFAAAAFGADMTLAKFNARHVLQASRCFFCTALPFFYVSRAQRVAFFHD